MGSNKEKAKEASRGKKGQMMKLLFNTVKIKDNVSEVKGKLKVSLPFLCVMQTQ